MRATTPVTHLRCDCVKPRPLARARTSSALRVDMLSPPSCLWTFKSLTVIEEKHTAAHLGGFLLELLDGSLVDSSAFVDQVTGGGGLAGVDMADDHDVDVDLFPCHCCPVLKAFHEKIIGKIKNAKRSIRFSVGGA